MRDIPADGSHSHPVPIQTVDRCALRAEQRSDPMLGTAFPAGRLLLVEQPGPWGRLGLLQSHFDPLAADRLTRSCDAAGIRVLAIRRPGRTEENRLRKWACVDGGLGREHLVWGEYTNERHLWQQVSVFVRGIWPQAAGPSAATDGPAYLICAHGSHDACCALRGRPIAAALELLRPGRAWECSHVGGDRFAANVLAVPSGLLYGSVDEDSLPALVAATDRGEALPGPLRGKIGLVPEVQAALARAHREWAGAMDSYSVGPVERRSGNVVRVRIHRVFGAQQQTADIDVSVRRSDVHRLTCQMTSPSRVLTYHPDSMVTV